MIEKNIPRDIAKYETKLIGPFTTRQIVCLVPGLGLAVAAYFLLKDYIGESSLFVSVVLGLPFLLAGWLKPYGMHFEKYVTEVLLKTVMSPTKRKYKTINADTDMLKEDVEVLQNTQNKKKHVSKNPELKELL